MRGRKLSPEAMEHDYCRKAVKIPLCSWETAMRKQEATKEVKRLFWGPEENAQTLLLFLVSEWILKVKGVQT